MPTTVTPQSIWLLRPGTIIRVSCGLYDHVGLVGDRLVNGDRGVVSFSANPGGFAEQSFSEFAAGRAVVADGFPSSLLPEVVLLRARSLTGRTYSWLTFNCEHFVRFAHDIPMESPQLQKWLFMGGMAGIAAIAVRG